MENNQAGSASAADSTAAVLKRAFEELHGFEIRTVERDAEQRATIAIVPEGKTLQDLKPILDGYRLKPERRKGIAKLVDAASFIAHLKRFADDHSVVFANPDKVKPSFTAVIDYHPSGKDASQTAWLGHRGVYEPALSDEWKVWNAKSGHQMTQADFAAFLEDRITDVIVPNFDDPNLKTFAELVQGRFASPSDLLQLSRGLAVNVETQVKNAVTLGTGEISVRYEETHRDNETGAPIQIANLFQICIPVFYAGPLYRIGVRLRYRIASGKLSWSFLLVRPDIVFDDAFRGIVKQVTDETTVPVLLGAPEA